MPWCHNCETEYVEGIEKCPDCGAELSEEVPPSMLPKPKLGWSFKNENEIADLAEWPRDENGEKIPPVYLTNIYGTQADYQMALSLLRAYKIPYACEFTGLGQMAKITVGFSISGMDIYVPETMLEDAKNILLSDTEDEK
jgi:hypothetical protein